jgi:hypothetical protein
MRASTATLVKEFLQYGQWANRCGGYVVDYQCRKQLAYLTFHFSLLSGRFCGDFNFPFFTFSNGLKILSLAVILEFQPTFDAREVASP